MRVVDLPPPSHCTKAPAGWVCTRRSDHDGPCAAIPVATPDKNAAQRIGSAAGTLVVALICGAFCGAVFLLVAAAIGWLYGVLFG